MSNRKIVQLVRHVTPTGKRTWNRTPPPSCRDQREEHARYLVMCHAEAGTIGGMDVLKLRHANTRWTAILHLIGRSAIVVAWLALAFGARPPHHTPKPRRDAAAWVAVA